MCCIFPAGNYAFCEAGLGNEEDLCESVKQSTPTISFSSNTPQKGHAFTAQRAGMTKMTALFPIYTSQRE